MSKDVWDMSDNELESAMEEERSELEDAGEEVPSTEPEPEQTEEQPDAEIQEEEVEVQDSPSEVPEDDSNAEGEEVVEEEESTENTGEQTSETSTETPATTQDFKPLRVDGEDIPINSIEELYTMASAGGRVTQKFQELGKHRRTISAMQEAGLTGDDVNLLIEAQNGNKDALAALMQKSGIDPMDIEEKPTEGYQPQQYGKSESEQAIADIQQMISRDIEYTQTAHIIDEVWDSESRSQIVDDPNIIMGLHNDVKSGVYDKVAPEAKKLAIADGMRRPQIEYYLQAGQLMNQNNSLSEPEPEKIQEEATRSAKRKSAGGNKGKRVAKSSKKDYLHMSDDEDQALRESIMSRA